MTDLETLLKQKREIEQQIKALKRAGYMRVGNVKIDTDKYPTEIPDEHYLAIEIDFIREGRMAKCWRSIYRSENRQEVIDAIPGIIKDLQGLYAEVTNGE